MKLLAIFPNRSAVWQGAERRLRAQFCGDVSFAYDLHTGGGEIENAEIVLSFALSPAAAAAAGKLRWVQALGTGSDNIDIAADRGIIVTTARALHGPAVSEAAMAMMLVHARSIATLVRNQAAHRWTGHASALLSGKSLGILGTGSIAGALARRAAAFEMRVTGFSRLPRPLADFDDVVDRASLVRVAPSLDYLVLLAPLEQQTRGMVDAAVLAALKPGALLVNVGRGALVDEQALIVALREGRLAAALDVFSQEPLAADSPLWDLPNVFVSPHSAGQHVGYMDDVLDLFDANLAAFRAADFPAMLNRIV